MKLRELLNNLNKALKPIKDRKFDLEDEECWNTVKQLIKPIINNTELQYLIKDEGSCISLYKEENIDTFNGGEPIIYRHYNCNRELKKIENFSFVFNKGLDKKILDFELIDLPKYFYKLNLKNNIEWIYEKITEKEKEIVELKVDLKKYITELEEM